MYVTVDVEDGKDKIQGAEVAARAVIFRDDKHYVFIEKQAGRFQRREVAVTDDHDGRTTVTKGIVPGERVVTEGSLYLQSILDNSEG